MVTSSTSSVGYSTTKSRLANVKRRQLQSTHSAPHSRTKTPIYFHNCSGVSDFNYSTNQQQYNDFYRTAKTEQSSIHAEVEHVSDKNAKSRRKHKVKRKKNDTKTPVDKNDGVKRKPVFNHENNKEKRLCLSDHSEKSPLYDDVANLDRNESNKEKITSFCNSKHNQIDQKYQSEVLDVQHLINKFSVYRIMVPEFKSTDEDDYFATYKSRQLEKENLEKYISLKNRKPATPFGISFDPYVIYNLGQQGSGLQARGRVQDFHQLKNEHLENGTLFEDRNFPPNNLSIYYTRQLNTVYEWKRPKEICQKPQFVVEGYSRFDIRKGALSNCWLLAAIANLTLYNKIFFQIVPGDQSFVHNYAGIFHFRFWQYGRWIDVVVDDRLPTCNGELVFLHSTEENEFWGALLEKAYAKLHGSYETLKGGSTCEAMEDFTGGVTEMYEMSNDLPSNLFQIMHKAFEKCSLMGCSIDPDTNILEAETPGGFIRSHAYSITKVKYVSIQIQGRFVQLPLIRLRDPWGNANEWTRPWSDQSTELNSISKHEKDLLGLTLDDDSEFWLSFDDFKYYFDRLEICNLHPDSLIEEYKVSDRKRWEVSFYEGAWVRGTTAGGRNIFGTFCYNPQYRITLTEVDEYDNDETCTLIVALMQKNRRLQRHMGVELLTIGYSIYHVPYPENVPTPLDYNFFKHNSSVARSRSFINLREVSCRFKLPPGVYCIIPSTFDRNEEGDFLLRVFSERKNNLMENDTEIAIREINPKAWYTVSGQLAKRGVSKASPSQKKKATRDNLTEETKQNAGVHDLFLRLAGEEKEIDWKVVKSILDYTTRLETRSKGYSKDVCRSMVAMLDKDHSGKLGYQELKTLWAIVKNWKTVFKIHDADNSGTLNGFELREAINSAGYKLNNRILNVLMHRYGNKDGDVEFNDFLMCAIKLKTMIDAFKEKDPHNTKEAIFTLEEWIQHSLYS